MDLPDIERELSATDEEDEELGTLSRRELLVLGAGAGLALALPGRIEAAPSGKTVRFLIAENFWANWEPYQNTAQSQFRINEQIYDHLVEFPSGDLTDPA